MPSAVAPHPRARVADEDELDQLFNFDAGIDETFNQPDQADENALTGAGRQNGQLGGLDEEIKVTKQRRPIAKLDEERLLSQQGLPKLRKISKDRLRLRGKGHEFTDMARVLNTYQLWLDDLFPKAKFLDGLEMIEKLGHKKRVQISRKEWIDESKPKPQQSEDEEDTSVDEQDGVVGDEGQTIPAASEEQPESNDASRESQELEIEEREADAMAMGDSTRSREQEQVPNRDHEPDEDELDMLLAEEAPAGNSAGSLFGGPTSNASHPPAPADFADDEEAMADFDW